MQPAATQRYFTPRFVLALIMCVALAAIWRAFQVYPLPLFDLYPLYYGGQAWLRFGNAYDFAPVVPASHHPYTVYTIGNGYPFPAVLLTLPLSLFPPTIAAMIWVGLLTAGLLLALRLHGNSWWLLLYLPLIEGLRLEQYTVLIVILQIVALWAWRTNRPWTLAICCALILTKPTQGALLVATLLLLARPWRQFAIAMLVIWGGSLLLDPAWPGQWLHATRTYAATTQWPILWWMALCAAPLLWVRDWVSSAVVLQLALAPFPGVYAASALPIGVLSDRWMRWLVVLGFLWPLPAILFDKGIATLLTLVLPLVVLVLLRRRTARPASASDLMAQPVKH